MTFKVASAQQIDSTFPCICSVIDHVSKCGKNRKGAHEPLGECCLCSHHILMSSVIYY